MQEEVVKGSSTKKKKKSKKSSSRSNLNSSSDTNYYENDTSDDYLYSSRDGSRLSSGTLEYEDITGMLIDNKPPMSDFHNNNNTSMTGGMAHYMPKATQHLFLSGLLEGEEIDDYFQDCRLDNALKNFGSFGNYEQPVIEEVLESPPPTKENHYETIEPEAPPSPEPTLVDNKRSSRYNNNNSHKLDILNWPTSPMTTSGPVTANDKQKRSGRLPMTSGVDSAGEDLDEDDNYIHLGGGIPPHSPGASSQSSANDSFDDTPWCNGVDVLY